MTDAPLLCVSPTVLTSSLAFHHQILHDIYQPVLVPSQLQHVSDRLAHQATHDHSFVINLQLAKDDSWY